MEAVKFTSTVTDRKGSWVGQAQSYSNTYANPVVVGQVMTYNDANFSAFWSRGATSLSPPSSSTLFAGKHVGEDIDTTRANETIGYIVIEAGSGTVGSSGGAGGGPPGSGPGAVNSVNYVAGLGTDTVRGVGDAPPYTYAATGLTDPASAVLSQAGADGNDGGWAILYGPSPVTAEIAAAPMIGRRLPCPPRPRTSVVTATGSTTSESRTPISRARNAIPSGSTPTRCPSGAPTTATAPAMASGNDPRDRRPGFFGIRITS